MTPTGRPKLKHDNLVVHSEGLMKTGDQVVETYLLFRREEIDVTYRRAESDLQ